MPNIWPVDTWANGPDVAKSDIRNGFRDFGAPYIPTADFGTFTTSGARCIMVGGVPYIYDAADTATAQDGTRVFVSADGQRYKLAGPASIVTTSNVVVTVPGMFATIQAALDALNSFVFASSATGTVLVAAGTYPLSVALNCRHLQPDKIILKAATARGARPAIVASAATTAANIRAAYSVVLEPTGTGFATVAGTGIDLQDIAFIGAGSGNGITAAARSVLRGTRIHVHNFPTGINFQDNTYTNIDELDVSHCTTRGLVATGNLSIVLTSPRSMRNTNEGIRITNGSRLRTIGAAEFSNNAGDGIKLFQGCYAEFLTGPLTSINNGGDGINLEYMCGARIANPHNLSDNLGYASRALYSSFIHHAAITVGSLAGTRGTIMADAMSYIRATGTHVGTPVFSPALGSEGNRNSMITT